jgi:hypothetical protein
MVIVRRAVSEVQYLISLPHKLESGWVHFSLKLRGKKKSVYWI